MKDIEIIESWWMGPEKNQLMTISEKYGRVIVSEGSEFWDDVLSKYTMDDLDRLSEEKTKAVEDERTKASQLEKERNEVDRQRLLFERKLEAFEIPEVKTSKNKQLRSRIRKAQSETEIIVFSTMIMMEEMSNKDD